MLSGRQARRLLQKLGLQMEELPNVVEVTLRLSDGKQLVVRNPVVYQLKSKEMNVLNIVGNLEEVKSEEEEIQLSEEDLKLVMEQTGASRDKALQALIEAGGDLAEAIMKLQQEK